MALALAKDLVEGKIFMRMVLEQTARVRMPRVSTALERELRRRRHEELSARYAVVFKVQTREHICSSGLNPPPPPIPTHTQ